MIAAGRRPTTTTTAGTPGTTPTTDPDSTPSPTAPNWPPTTGSTGRPTPPGTGHPGGGLPTTGTSTTTSTSRPGPGPDKGPDRFLVYIREASPTDPADSDLFIGDLDGRHERQVTIGPDRDQFPAWSPDGSTIAFNRITRGGSDELWSIRADGSGLRQLTFSGAGAKHEPTWSPDGRFLAYTAAYFNPTRVWLEVLDLATGQMTKITPGVMDGQPLWSPTAHDPSTRPVRPTATTTTTFSPSTQTDRTPGHHRRAVRSQARALHRLRWSADGSRLLVYDQGSDNGHIITLRPDGRAATRSSRPVSPTGPPQGSARCSSYVVARRAMIVFNGYNGLYPSHRRLGHRRLDRPKGSVTWRTGNQANPRSSAASRAIAVAVVTVDHHGWRGNEGRHGAALRGSHRCRAGAGRGAGA